jgi:hypothetical protein
MPTRSTYGLSEKEQRQYEHVNEEAEKEGRYRGREKEVCAHRAEAAQRGTAKAGKRQ